MARRKAVRPKPETFAYRILDEIKVGNKMLGPHVIVEDEGNKFVVLTESQAQFYLDQGVIERA